MQIRMFQKFQPEAERGTAKYCELCKQEFGVFLREHQCKRCFRAICADCGTEKRDVYKPKMGKRPHRLCKPCRRQSDFLIQYIEVNKLKFGEQSQLGSKWHKKLPENIGQSPNGMKNAKQCRKFTIQLFNEVWDAYNYSLRQFIGLLTFNLNQSNVYKLVNSVYEELQNRGLQEKMENVIYVIIFVLCFANFETCCNLVQYLCSLKKTVSDGKQLLQLYLKALSITDAEVKKLSDYYNYKLKQYIGSLSINSTTAQCTIHVLTRIFQKKKIDEAYMFFALVLESNSAGIIENRANKNKCDFQIIRECQLDKFLQKYRLLVTVKSTPFISIRSNTTKLDVPSGLNQQLQVSGKQPNSFDNSDDVKFVANFKKKKYSFQIKEGSSEDNFSNKTKSIRDIEAGGDIEDSPRKTQKASILMNMKPEQDRFEEDRGKKHSTMSENKKDSPYKSPKVPEGGPCSKCQENLRLVQELQQKISQKQRQISKLNLKLSFKNRESEYFEEAPHRRKGSQQFSKQNEQIAKLQRQILEKTEQSDSVFRELTKYQKQNSSLKAQLEQLSTNNRMLKNKLQSANLFTSSSFKNSQKQEQLTRVNELLKKTLMQKNKQLEDYMKRNKLLSYQLQEDGRRKNKSQDSKGREGADLDCSKLLEKIQQLSDLVSKEQGEKIQASNQLFQLKEVLRKQQKQQLQHRQSAPPLVRNSASGNQCLIF